MSPNFDKLLTANVTIRLVKYFCENYFIIIFTHVALRNFTNNRIAAFECFDGKYFKEMNLLTFESELIQTDRQMMTEKATR